MGIPHDVSKSGTLMVKVRDDVPSIANVNIPGLSTAMLGTSDNYELEPRHIRELHTVSDSMDGYSDEDLESMARIGRKAQLALDMRRKKPISTEQVEEACQAIIRR